MAKRYSTMSPRQFMDGLMRAKIIKHQYEVRDYAVIETENGQVPIGGEASWTRWLYKEVVPSLEKQVLLKIRFDELMEERGGSGLNVQNF